MYLCTNELRKRMRLREILKEKKISGAELARRLGVSSSYVNMVAKGSANMSIEKCRVIADALGVPLAAMFDGYSDPNVTVCPHCGKRIKLVIDED